MEKAVSNSAYNKIAKSYDEKIDTKPHNAYYDRPALKMLIPNVKNKNILDAGCGVGVYMEWLISKGANVTGFDASEEMLAFAKKRVGTKAKLFNGCFEDDFSFLKHNFFDGILSALSITYVKNLEDLFIKFNRVLKQDGWFIFSTEHPFFSYKHNNIQHYFTTKKVENEWSGFDEPVMITSYYHSLGCITEALYNSGFMIEQMIEPKPTKDFEKVDKKRYDDLMKFPLFICFKAIKVKTVDE